MLDPCLGFQGTLLPMATIEVQIQIVSLGTSNTGRQLEYV